MLLLVLIIVSYSAKLNTYIFTKVKQQFEMNKRQKSAARKRTFRSEQTDEAKADASAQLQARMTYRNQQSEEEQEQRSEQAQARMTPLRGNQTPAEQKEATSLNSKARATLRENLSED